MKNNERFYKITGSIVLMILLLPLGQEYFHFFKIKELQGEYTKYQKPTLSAAAWVNENFQDSMENYSKLNFGFSPKITQLHNQLLFTLFNATRSPSVVIGKQQEIYDYGHIQAYMGEDYVGESVIQKKVNDLIELQNLFQLFNTQIIVVLAPSKASFSPEHIPNEFKSTNKVTNYDIYHQLLQKSKYSFVDFSIVFKKWKTKSAFPLYPQCGVHWSEYGATLAADSILKYIESQQHIDLPDLEIDSVIESSQLSESDYDMGRILNLLYPIKPYPMGYPQLKINEDSRHQRLSLLSISDSYYWIWYNQVGFSNQFFKNSRFYEYYKSYHTVNGDQNSQQIDMVDQVIKSNIVLIVCSESNLYRLGFGFVEEMHQLIPEFKKRYRKMIQKNKYEIMLDASWYQSIQNKAVQNEISVDSMLTLDAIYVAQHTLK